MKAVVLLIVLGMVALLGHHVRAAATTDDKAKDVIELSMTDEGCDSNDCNNQFFTSGDAQVVISQPPIMVSKLPCACVKLPCSCQTNMPAVVSSPVPSAAAASPAAAASVASAASPAAASPASPAAPSTPAANSAGFTAATVPASQFPPPPAPPAVVTPASPVYITADGPVPNAPIAANMTVYALDAAARSIAEQQNRDKIARKTAEAELAVLKLHEKHVDQRNKLAQRHELNLDFLISKLAKLKTRTEKRLSDIKAETLVTRQKADQKKHDYEHAVEKQRRWLAKEKKAKRRARTQRRRDQENEKAERLARRQARKEERAQKKKEKEELYARERDDIAQRIAAAQKAMSDHKAAALAARKLAAEQQKQQLAILKQKDDAERAAAVHAAAAAASRAAASASSHKATMLADAVNAARAAAKRAALKKEMDFRRKQLKAESRDQKVQRAAILASQKAAAHVEVEKSRQARLKSLIDRLNKAVAKANNLRNTVSQMSTKKAQYDQQLAQLNKARDEARVLASSASSQSDAVEQASNQSVESELQAINDAIITPSASNNAAAAVA